MRMIEIIKEEILKAEKQAFDLLWENLENSWVDYVQEHELDDRKVEEQYDQIDSCTAMHHSAIENFYYFLTQQNKSIDNLIKPVLHRAANLRNAYVSFAKHVYPKRREKLSDEDRSEAENALLAIYVNIFGLFDCWAHTLNECLPGEKITEKNKNKIGIKNKQFRKRANLKEIRDIWNSNNEWYNHRINTIRDPFIHRTPPHIVRFFFTDEKEQQRYYEIERKLLEFTLERKLAEYETLEEEQDELGFFADRLVVDENNEKVMNLLVTVLDDVLRTNYISMQFAKIAIDHIEN